MTYAVRVVDGTVSEIIVGDAEWATSRLGGVWLDSEVLVGIGWLVVDGQILPPEPGETDVLDFEMES
jgi:hypothetical protein